MVDLLARRREREEGPRDLMSPQKSEQEIAEEQRLAALDAGRADRLRQSEDEIRQQIAEESDAFLPSVGRGLHNVGRGIKMGADALLNQGRQRQKILQEIDEEEELFAPLEEAQPYATLAGELVGETAPFLLPGGALARGGKIAQTLSAGAVGAAEAATIAAGSGQDASNAAGVGGATAAGLSLALPVIGRVGGKVVRRALGKAPTGSPVGPDGIPSAELTEAMRKSGLEMDDLYRYADEFKGARNEGELIRQGIFDDLDIPTTRSRITQKSDDFLTERRLSRDTSDAAGVLRQRLSDESAGFAQAAERQINDLGLPRVAGQSVQDALEDSAKGMRTKADKLYKDVANLNKGAGIPMTGDDVLMAVPGNKRAYSAYKSLSNAERQKVSDILTEYGLDSNPDAVANWAARRQRQGGTIGLDAKVKPLNTSNFNDMLRDLNSLIDPQKKELNSVVRALKDGVNKEIDSLGKAVDGSTGVVGENAKEVIDAVRRANKYYAQMSGVLDEKEIVGQLIKKRAGSFDEPHILASQVVDKISGGGRLGSIESTDRLVRELRRAGAEGEQALGNVQSATILDFMNRAMPKSGKTGVDGMENIIDWSGTNFSKAIDSFGRDKLESLFANNPAGLNQLLKLEQAGLMKTAPANVAKASGTADDLLSAVSSTLGNAPILREYMQYSPTGMLIRSAGRSGEKGLKNRAAAKQTKKMLDTSPVLKEKMEFLRLQYPQVAGLVGANVASKDDEEK